MVVKLFLTITILLQVDYIRTNNLYRILEIKENFFHKVNTELHNVISNMFSFLKTMKYYAKPENNEILLHIHNDLMNITEMNFKAYFFSKNVSVTNFTPGLYAKQLIDGTNEVLSVLLKKNQDLNPMRYLRSLNDTEESHLTDNDVSNTDGESNDFLVDFLKTFEKITVENITNYVKDNSSYNENVNKGKNKTTGSRRVNLILKSPTVQLKVWNSSILDKLSDNKTRRLYQAKPTKIKNYPFLVSVHIMNNFMCSGSIISKDLVVTSASCLQVAYSHHDSPRSVFIRVGSDYTKSFGQLIPVSEIHFHYDYDPRTLRNNIAVLRIIKNLRLSKEKGRIRRIEYDRGTNMQTEPVFVLGWGAQEPNHNPSNFQKLAIDRLNIYGLNECKEVYTEMYVTDSNFCAGFANKGSGACNKDVGGPGFRDGILVGIVSFGPPNCGMPNSPTVFTQLGYYADWLDGFVHQKKILREGRPVQNSVIEQQDQAGGTVNPHIHSGADYPQEVVILKEMLEEILTTNETVVDDMLKMGKKKYNNIRKNKRKVNFDVETYKEKEPQYDNTEENIVEDINNVESVPEEDESGCKSENSVSDNYETNYEEIDIDTNNPAIKNASFLDVVLNFEQYQKYGKDDESKNGKNKVQDIIDIQLFVGTTQAPVSSKSTPKWNKPTRFKTKDVTRPGIQPKKLYYDDIEVGGANQDFSLNFESDREQSESWIKNKVRSAGYK